MARYREYLKSKKPGQRPHPRNFAHNPGTALEQERRALRANHFKKEAQRRGPGQAPSQGRLLNG